MKYNITHDDYTFVDNNFNELWAIRLLTRYENVVYCYGKVTAKVVDEGDGENDGLANMSFQYQILEPADYNEEELESDEEFNDYIGDVLVHIIEDSFKTGNYKIGENATDDSNNSTQESSQQ